MSHQNREKNPRPSNTGVHSPKRGGASLQDGGLFPLKQGVEVTPESDQKALVSLDWLAFTVPSKVVELAWNGKAGRVDVGTYQRPLGVAREALTALEKTLELGGILPKGVRVAPTVGPSLAWALADALRLPCESLEETGKGFQGWSRSWAMDGMGGAKLAVGGQNGTARVVFSAEALRYYQASGWDVWAWVQHMHGIGANCRHIDIAFDDLGGWLSREKIIEAAFAHNVVSRYGNKYDPDILGSASGERGWTIDFGAYGGQTFVKIYDKAKERKVKGHELPEDTHWVRVEATFRGDRAEKALGLWEREGFSASFAVSLLRGLLDFRENQEDQQIHPERWPVLPWWGDFLGNAEVVHLGTDSKERTMRELFEHTRRIWGPTLAAIQQFYGDEGLSRLVSGSEPGPLQRRAMDVSRAMGDVDLPA